MSHLKQFVSSNEICKAVGISKRTLQRRLHDEANKLPQACIKRIGAASMWELSIAEAWIERELSRTREEQLSLNFGGGHE